MKRVTRFRRGSLFQHAFRRRCVGTFGRNGEDLRIAGPLLAVLAIIHLGLAGLPAHARQPDIILILFDDLSPRLGAYGDRLASTPHLDAFARHATRFDRAYTTSAVCAPSRAALFSGMHQQSIGAQHHRTRGVGPWPGGGPVEYLAVPPPEVKFFPELLRREGYASWNVGKTDYQVGDPFTIWTRSEPRADWENRPRGRPLLAVFNIAYTHESYLWPPEASNPDPAVRAVAARNKLVLNAFRGLTKPADVSVPSYLPDTSIVRQDLARLYDNVAFADAEFGRLIARLKAEGLYDDSIILVTSDHGDGLPRVKRALQAPGLRVPLFLKMPGRTQARTRSDLVSFVDLAPTILALAGAPPAAWHQGRVFAGRRKAAEPSHVLAGADRFDETASHQRTLIGRRYQYIVNHRPDLPALQRLAYRENLPTMQEIRRLEALNALSDGVAQWLSAPRPTEELYDLLKDPDCQTNLANAPAASRELARARGAFARVQGGIPDLSRTDERTMVYSLWNGTAQPSTPQPTFREEAGFLHINAADMGSIGWRLAGEQEWALYGAPIPIRVGRSVEAKSIRYGWQESGVATYPSAFDRGSSNSPVARNAAD